MGVLDGENNDTLKFYYKDTNKDVRPIAPFQYVCNANFTNLTVGGHIVRNYNGAAGLIGNNTISTSTNTYVNDVVVCSVITCFAYEDDDNAGGFAKDGSGVRFENCVFSGDFGSVFTYAGGFCGLGNKYTELDNCLFDPNSCEYWGDNFVYTTDSEFTDSNLVNCFYTDENEDETIQGIRKYSPKHIPNQSIIHSIKIIHGSKICDLVTVEIIDIDDEYIIQDGDGLELSYLVTYNNGANAIAEGAVKDTIKNSSNAVITGAITTNGTYRLIVSGNKEDYFGSISKGFTVSYGTYGSWSALQDIITHTNDPIKLNCYYRAGSEDGPLVIDRDVTIDLNGYKIDRHLSTPTKNGQVFIINSGKTVTIKDTSAEHKGIITGGYNKASNTTEHGGNNDGGGIRNLGYLTLENITISGNRCIKYQTGTSATARGGGVYSAPGSTLIMTNVVIKDNESQGGGGGIFADGSGTTTLNMDGCVVRSNNSYDKGCGIRVKGCSTAVINNSEIVYNVLTNLSENSAANGGGIHVDNCTLNLYSCNISHNNSTKNGGGIYLMSGSARVNATDCIINYNQCYDENGQFNSRGGGIYMYAGSFYMDGGSIVGNQSKLANGGGVFMKENTSFHLQGNVKIKDNMRFTVNNSLVGSNFYIAGKTDNNCITIDGDITGSEIWVSKNGGSGVITKNLEDYGSTSQFVSDDGYTISYADGEIKLVDPALWSNEVIPSGVTHDGNAYTITKPVTISSTLTNVASVSFADDGCIIIADGSYLETNIIISSSDSKKDSRVVIYGGQLKLTTDDDVLATMKKDISRAYDLDDINWYLLSSGMAETRLIQNTNLIVAITNEDGFEDVQYDLYRFNEAADLQWENYRNTEIIHTDFDIMQSGRGYLYRNGYNYTATISGTLNNADVDGYALSYSGSNALKGFHILGNPYSYNITKGATSANILNGVMLESNYYVLNAATSSWVLTDDGTAIPPMTGILVQAKDEGSINIIKNPSSGGSKNKRGLNDNIWFTISNSQFEDRACVEFKDGHGLNKIAHLNEKAPMLYINHNGEDFASVDVGENVKEISLNFKAMTTGSYTLSWKPNRDYKYLHIIDRLTGEDIDMMNEEEYTFIGSKADAADRFLVRLSPSTGPGTGSETFAWQNGNDIIVNGNGELQVFDVMGRMVATRHINGVQSVNGLNNGVYIFRLEEKTQKIVVR